MKKIEDLAAEKYISEQGLPERKRTPTENYIDWAVFGAKEAQRWFPIEGNIPAEIDLIFKSRNGKHTIGKVGVMECKLCIITDQGYSLIDNSWFTHWRPVERV